LNLIRVVPAKGVLVDSARSDRAGADLVVVGAGVIGLAIAWQAARSGRRVTVVDPADGQAASWVAAGMLAPVAESSFGEEPLLRLNLLALARFPAFAAALEAATGLEVGLRREGTLSVAYDAGDRAVLARMAALRRSYGLAADELDAGACRRLEPFLSADAQGGVLSTGDWSVDNRRYLAALRTAAAAAGVATVTGRVVRIDITGGQVSGVTLAGGAGMSAGTVVIAAGAWSSTIGGVPARVRVRPVKGQLLRLRLSAGMPPVLRHTVRGTVRGSDVYLVPRADGEVVVGATSEERGFERTVTAAAVHDLLRDAMALVPVVGELELAETGVGLRPGTADNAPVVGRTELAGLLVATGHYRNGVLQSAATAEAVGALLDDEQPAPEWAPFAGRAEVLG
jgi:glycine oxidase